MTTVVHLTTAHSPFDPRIFHKEARSLSNAGYDVFLVAHHDEEVVREGVHVIPLGDVSTRWQRWLNIIQCAREAYRLDADVYHFHDPELMGVGVLLKVITDADVIYDIHEDFEHKIRTREWIPERLRSVLSRIFPTVQSLFATRFDACITVTEWIADTLRDSGIETTVVRNLPLTENISESGGRVPRQSEHVLVYVGGLSEGRGVLDMIAVTEVLLRDGFDVELWLIGSFETESAEKEVEARLSEPLIQEHVRLFGRIDHSEVFNYLESADVGLAILDTKFFKGSLPTKLIEYMVCGLPIVATPFDATDRYLPRECGVLVPEGDPEAQASTIASLLNNTEQIDEMGRQSRLYAESNLTWKSEEEQLLNLYARILESS